MKVQHQRKAKKNEVLKKNREQKNPPLCGMTNRVKKIKIEFKVSDSIKRQQKTPHSCDQ